MHLILIARAEKNRLEKWKNDLAAIHFPVKTKIVKGKNIFQQLCVKKIELLDLSFPKKELDGMLKRLQIDDKYSVDWKDAPIINTIIQTIRKALKLKKIPEYNSKEPRIFLDNNYIDRTALGIKEDIEVKGEEQI